MKTYSCFKGFDVARLVILLCFTLTLFASGTCKANSVPFAYDHAIIQNTEVMKCWSLRYLSEETIELLASNGILRDTLLLEIAEQITKELGVTVRSIGIKNKNLLCISYAYGHKKSTPSSSFLTRFY